MNDPVEMLANLDTPVEEEPEVKPAEGDKEPEAKGDKEPEVDKLPVGYEPPEEGAEKTPEKKPEEGKGDEKKEEEPAVDPVMAAMMDKMEQMGTAITALTTHVAERKPDEAPEMPAFEYNDSAFVTSEDKFDKMLKTPEAFNDTMNMIAEYAAAKAVEHFNKVMPGLVGSEAVRAADTSILIRLFWRDNKDLSRMPDAKKRVAQTYRELEAINPGRTPEDLFDLLAPAVRQKFKVAAPDSDKKKKKAAFIPGPTGNRTIGKVPDTMTVAEEITQMENL